MRPVNIVFMYLLACFISGLTIVFSGMIFLSCFLFNFSWAVETLVEIAETPNEVYQTIKP